MSVFAGQLASLVGSGLLQSVGDVADRFIQTKDEKARFKLALERCLQQREGDIEQTIRAELGAKERIMVAELNQGDQYTKRARPTILYGGLLIIGFNYCVIPVIQMLSNVTIDPFALPSEFWLAWGGVASLYSVGRSAEKRGAKGRWVEMSSGARQTSVFD